MSRIPIDPNGYKVNPETGTIHTRYADLHAAGYRTRTTKGVLDLLDGKRGKACEVCYGKAPQYPDTPRPVQRRRSSANGTVKSWAAPSDMPEVVESED